MDRAEATGFGVATVPLWLPPGLTSGGSSGVRVGVAAGSAPSRPEPPEAMRVAWIESACAWLPPAGMVGMLNLYASSGLPTKAAPRFVSDAS